MPFFFPDELSQWGEGTWYGSKPDKVSGFSIDARKIRDGEMFVALQGQEMVMILLDRHLIMGLRLPW